MRLPVLLLVLALLPGASAGLPVETTGCVGVPCVVLAPPTYVGADAQCFVWVNTVGDAVLCDVNGGKAGAAVGLCETCLGITLLACSVGTEGVLCLE